MKLWLNLLCQLLLRGVRFGQFMLFYFCVIHFRAIRMLFRPPITGDTNWCSTPLIVANRIFNHPLLGSNWGLVDVGCGEGLLGVFIRLVKGRPVQLVDTQPVFLRMITRCCRWLLISGVRVGDHIQFHGCHQPVVFCSWESWSKSNRRATLNKISAATPPGGLLITIGHRVTDNAWVHMDQRTETFAWGKSWVYYYKHA